MIVYLTVRYSDTIHPYLHGRGRHLAGSFRVLPYHALGQTRSLPRATYVFADVERLAPAQAALAEQVYDAIAAQSPPLRILNHPTRSLTRYPLLRALRAQGVNTFRAERADADLTDIRFPVFLRGADDLLGTRTPHIYTHRELDAAVNHALLHGFQPRDILVVEYEDTRGPDGLFRKHGALRLGDRIIPRHLWFARSWAQKQQEKRLTDDQLQEEHAHMSSTGHHAELMDIFATARIEFGRIDYAVVDGRLTVWEINTNPSLFRADPAAQQPARVPFDDLFNQQLTDAWHAVDTPAEQAAHSFPYDLRRPRAGADPDPG